MKASQAHWDNVEKVYQKDLKAGDLVLMDNGEIKEVFRLSQARQPGYVVIQYKDGSRGGSHGKNVINVTSEKKFMAYNHNGRALMNEPASRKKAEQEAMDYRAATMNPAYVEEFKDKE